MISVRDGGKARSAAGLSCPAEIVVLNEWFNIDHLNFKVILAKDSNLEYCLTNIELFSQG